MVYFATSPVFVARRIRHFRSCVPPQSYQNWYGITRGFTGPHQGSTIWERWFEPGQKYAGPGSLDEKKSRELSATVAQIESAFKVPFVNKWQGHSVHIHPLVEALPNLLFIRLRRDPLQVAQSVLKSRLELRGTANSWTSVRPSQYNRIKDKRPIEQVCGQIYYLEQDIDRDSEAVGKERFFEVDYKRICEEPRQVLRDIKNFYEVRSGYSLVEREPIPASFPYSNAQKVAEADLRALSSCLERLQNG
jgi:hypothetical protein